MNLRVSIVDDDEPISRILAELIRESKNLEFVSSYNDSEIALRQLPTDRPDVVLMDINIPGLSGIECVRRLKPELPQTQFLMLTVYADSDHIFAALSAGATGYLLKGTKRGELLAAIRQIATGGSPMSAGIARKVVQSFAAGPGAARPNTETLSPRERSVLDLLAQGYLYKEIAESLNLSVATVDTYVRRVYEKLQVNSRSQAIAKYLKR
jgi:DNA-binding NarL/FixJ family response regulator